MRAHSAAEAVAVVDAVEDWQDVFGVALGRRMVHAADEYYLMAGRPFPAAETYEGFTMHEDGIGMARTFELEFNGTTLEPTGTRRGFFAAADADPSCASLPPNPAAYTGVRADQAVAGPVLRRGARRRSASSGASSAHPSWSAARRRSPRRPRHPGRQRVLRRQHRRDGVDDRR